MKARMKFLSTISAGLFGNAPTFCAVHNLQLLGGHPCRRCETEAHTRRAVTQIQFNERTVAAAEQTIRIALRARRDAQLELAAAAGAVDVPLVRSRCAGCGETRAIVEHLQCAACVIKEDLYTALQRFVAYAHADDNRHAGAVSVADFGLSASSLSRAEMLMAEIGGAR